jgi:protein TonB
VQLSTNPGQQLTPTGKPSGPERRQRQRLILALVLFLSAIGVVIYKNRASQVTPESVVVQSPAPVQPSASEASADAPRSETKTPEKSKRAKHKAEKTNPDTVRAESYTPTVSRTALPPLEVEVYAGGRPVPVKPKPANAIHVDTTTGTEGRAASPAPTDDSGLAMSASERVRISPEALQVLSHPVDPNYPLLAREMKVQGSVVLDAVIGRDGAIQSLKIVSGPTILANAAMEAVRQWRFKPYYQEGEAVETEARITVNFTISTT